MNPCAVGFNCAVQGNWGVLLSFWQGIWVWAAGFLMCFSNSFWQGILGCVFLMVPFGKELGALGIFSDSFWQGILGWAFLLIPFVKEFPGPRGHASILLSRINLVFFLQEFIHCLIQ